MPICPFRFSAIVVTYHTGPVLNACLAALLDAPLCNQIILVNNGNPPGVVAALSELARQHTKLFFMDGHGNVGFGCGCNLGVGVANEDLIVLVNPDCVIDAGTLPAMAHALTDHPDALIGGALRNQDGSEQRGCRRGELTVWSAFVSFLGLGRPGAEAGIWRDFNRTREAKLSEVSDMPVVSGALMAMSRATFDRVSGFDPAFFLHVEDIDLCRRVREGGCSVKFAPDATGLHIGATSETSSWFVERAKIASFRHYFWKYARTPLDYLSVAMLIPVIAAAIILRKVSRG